MEYLSRLSGLVGTPSKAASGSTAASGSRLRKKPSLHPVGSVDVFHADWTAVKQELQSPDERALFHGVTRSDLPRRLQRIVDALVFENNRSNDGHTGPCMEYLLKYDILTELVELSAEDRPLGIMGETIRTLTNLIILLDEKFLSRRTVHKPISQLIQRCLDEDAARFDFDEESAYAADASLRIAEPAYNEDLVDLMCHIASRIRNTPDLLQIVFSDELIDSDATLIQDLKSSRDGSVILPRQPPDGIPDRSVSPTGSADSTATVQPAKAGQRSSDSADSSGSGTPEREHKTTRRLRFPLFSYMLKFAHREGRIGELARAGLLFLISLEGLSTTANSNDQSITAAEQDVRLSLGTFIAHSDFADVLGAGLGAAYGLLPSRIRPAKRYDPTVVALNMSDESIITLGSGSTSDAPSTDNAASATASDDPELQAQLRLLVDLLDFCQDVLDSLLRHVPPEHALLGSSELIAMVQKLAGGIAAAVRDTFIRNVIYPSLMESSDSDGSATAVLSYLDVIILVLRDGHILTNVVLDFLLASNASSDVLGIPFGLDARLDPDRYSIKDLILDNMHSQKRTPTKVAALQLARTLLVRHGRRAACGLLNQSQHSEYREGQASDDEHDPHTSDRSIDTHLREIDQYAALFAKDSAVKLQMSLATYLTDAEQGLRHDSTFADALLPANASHKTRLDRSDPFVQRLFDGLAQLFMQPVEANVAASGVIAALALSPARSLEGWLTYERSHSKNVCADEDVPALLAILRELSSQTQAYRDCIPDFDRHLAERRRGLALAEDITEALEADDILDADASDAEKADEGQEADESSTKRRPMRASLSLPRVNAPRDDDGSKVQTDERRREAERHFGVVEDGRSELGSSRDSQLSTSAFSETVHPADDAAKGEGETRSSALARLFGGRPTRSSAPGARSVSGTSTASAGEANLRRPSGGVRKVSASTINPYTADHYRQTAAVLVRAQTAAAAPDWRPAVSLATQSESSAVVTLSSVLDNTILLQELVKELLAIIQVRRSWGIDPILFT